MYLIFEEWRRELKVAAYTIISRREVLKEYKNISTEIWKPNTQLLQTRSAVDVGPKFKSRPKSRRRPAYAADLPLPVCESSHNRLRDVSDKQVETKNYK